MIELPPKSPDLLADCLGWQKILDQAPNVEARNHMAKVACSELEPRTFDTSRLIVKSDAAFVVSALGRSACEKGLQAIQFGTVTAQGNLGKTSYLSMKNGTGVLTWPVYDAEVLDLEELVLGEDVDPSDVDAGLYMPGERPLRMPVHMPVGLIDYAIPAAR